MRYSELQKGGVYFCYQRLFVGDKEVFLLRRKQITVLTAKTIEICTLNGRGAPTFRSRQRVYNPATATFTLYASPGDAKAALVNTLLAQIKSAEQKVVALTAELNEALMLDNVEPAPETKP